MLWHLLWKPHQRGCVGFQWHWLCHKCNLRLKFKVWLVMVSARFHSLLTNAVIKCQHSAISSIALMISGWFMLIGMLDVRTTLKGTITLFRTGAPDVCKSVWSCVCIIHIKWCRKYNCDGHDWVMDRTDLCLHCFHVCWMSQSSGQHCVLSWAVRVQILAQASYPGQGFFVVFLCPSKQCWNTIWK